MSNILLGQPSENPHPFDVIYITNPDQEELRRIALEHSPATYITKYGNINKLTRNKARFAKYTYLIAPEEDSHLYSSKVIDPQLAERIVEHIFEYIRLQGKLIEIQGYYGVGDKAFPIQWFYTMAGSNVAAMQQVLSFSREEIETPEQLQQQYRPVIRLVYVPEFPLPYMPGKMAMVVDLEHYTTYVVGADYFGESKKGALRMLNDYVYQRGGLVLHAGCKMVTIGDEHITMTIKGLSGTGKTTTTFSKQGEMTRPIQDDMVCLWPGGRITITENGAFAKTYGLKEDTEPIIFRGTIAPSAWVENVYTNEDGSFDFSKDELNREEVGRISDLLMITQPPAKNINAYVKGEVDLEDKIDDNKIPDDGWDFLVWTQNGRSIFPLSLIPGVPDLNTIPPVRSMGILNRDEGADAAMPGIVRFVSTDQAAAYFMLGETSKTSAAGKERGRTRSPFTQPFFPRPMGLQAMRFAELTADIPDLVTWLMNTGYVGGDQHDVDAGTALKVKIPHSSAMLEALLKGNVVWKLDPDFRYEIVDVDAPENAALLEKVPAEIMNPILFFEKYDKMDMYRAWVQTMKHERREFLKSFDVNPRIIDTIPE
jgi:phosphoenolpyruvate carboxykinase (ATP)